MRSGRSQSISVFVCFVVLSFVAFTNQAHAKSNTTTTLTSSLNPSIYGQSITLTATVTGPTGSGTPTGTVNFVNGSNTVTKTLSGGVATFTTANLNAGTYSITAVYSGDSNFNTSTSSPLSQVVNKASSTTTLTSSPNPSSFNQSVTFTATLTGQFGGTPGGSVTFTSGSTTLCSGVTLSGGVATCSYAMLPVGSNTVTAAFLGSPNFLSSSGSETQTVNKAATTTVVTGTPNPSSFKQSITLTATVTGAFGSTPTGTVTFTSGSTTLCSAVALSGGVATCAYAALPIGTDSITATYSGDANFLASSGSWTQTVNKAATTTALASTPNPSSFNQSVTFTATVTSAFGGTPTGTVTFTSGSTTLCNAATLTSGTATCAYAALPVGSDSVTAAYSGDSNYSTSSGSETQTVNKATSTTALTSTPNPSTFHQSVTFTATVTGQFGGTPTGTVTFTSGSTTLCNTVTLSSGVATCAYTGLSAGSDTVTAAYNGDGNYATSSGTETQTVNKATSTTTLTSSPNPSSFDQSVTFTATLTGQFGGTPGGLVTFTSGSTTLCSNVTLSGGVATCPYSTLPVGSNSVTAAFGGSPNFLPSSGSETQTVTKAASTTALTSTPNPSGFKQSVTFTATVTGAFGGTPTGTVTFTSGSTTLCNTVTLSSGVATCAYAALPVGSNTVTAAYSGDGNYAASSGSETQTVNKATTTTALTSTPNPSTFNQSVTFTATVTGTFGGTPTGTVTFTSGVTTLCNTVTLSGGVATCASATLPAGSDTVTAAYSGDGNYAASSGSETQTVSQASSTTTLTSSPNPSSFNQSVTFTATVNPASGSGATPTGTVTFTSGATTLCNTVGLGSGVATCVYSTLPSGSDLVTASYSGDNNYSSSSGSITQTVNAVLVSISVSPQGVSMATGATQQYSAEGTYNDGSSKDITSTVTWASSVQTVATITSGGLATGVSQASSAEMTTISASSGSVQPGTSTMTVYPANTFFVAPNGSDTWSGHLATPNSQTNPTDGPLASPAEAVLKVRSANQANNQQVPINVYLRAGTYYLAESPTNPGTLTLNNQYDSGSASAGITWQSYPGDAAPIISGSVPANTGVNSWPGAGLNLNWVLKQNTQFGNWYQATLPLNLNISGTPLQNFEYFFYNGERRLRSRVHDTVSPSVGFYMSSTGCSAIPGWPAGEFPTVLASCNLGSFLRVTGTIAPTDPLGSYNGNTCVSSSGTDSKGNPVTKCLDRFYFTPPSGSGADVIENWANLTSINVPSQPCSVSTNYPAGDVTLVLFDAWTVDAMRVNCVDTTNNVIYLAGVTKSGGGGDNYYFFGPTVNHRFIIENNYNAFQAAQSLQETGIWFLDRNTSNPNGQWVLNYIANSGETPSTADIEIPQLGGTIPGAPATDYVGGSLINATNLNYVTFRGITFEMDNFYPTTVGFNNDVNGEYPLPQAIDCEGCQFVTFDTVTLQHTSASGILAAATSTTPACSSLSLPTTTNYCVLIQNSGFYDIGDSAIRVGHTPSNNDTSGTIVVQDVWAKNNLIQGFSRVFADGEGIAEGNGNYNLFSNNTITDGYHAGISVCFNGCPPAKSGANINGNHITSENNLLSNLMQGITSDGGSLYYNVGGPSASGVQDYMTSNVIHDVTDSYIIDVVGTTKADGTGYGGEGLYLDAQTAGVNVSNNVVYNVTGHAIHITEGLGSASSSTEVANTFNNNILAFANAGMFTQGNPWINSGCPSTGTVQQVNVTNNLFYFDVANGQAETGRPAFSVVQGCTDSCIGSFTSSQSYNNYQNFSGNDYWDSVEMGFGTDTKAFQIESNQGSGGLSYNSTSKTYSCTNAGGTVALSFGTAPSWQSGGNGVPVMMNEDTTASGGEIFNFQPNNTSFPTRGYSTSTPTDFEITNGQGLPANFNPSLTNNTITGSGSTISNPNPTCSTFPNAVCPTFPTYLYGSTTLPF